jgi:hypothetical protein
VDIHEGALEVVKLEVRRFEYGTNYTVGKLYIDGIYECYTLEREAFPHTRKPAIPKGSYSLVIDDSTRFQRPMPHILDVPGYEGIRIHSGNTDADTEGCILVGTTWAGVDFIGNSKVAFAALFSKMQAADKMVIEIKDAVE